MIPIEISVTVRHQWNHQCVKCISIWNKSTNDILPLYLLTHITDCSLNFLTVKMILKHFWVCLAVFTIIMLMLSPSCYKVVTSTRSLLTWPSHSIQNQRCWGTSRSSHCISGPCRWRTGPSSGWYNAPQRMCSRSAHITSNHSVTLQTWCMLHTGIHLIVYSKWALKWALG